MTEVENTDLTEAALIIPVPEAEPHVASLRLRNDPSAALGVPAHITINYPFIPGVQPTDELLGTLEDHFSRFVTFEYELREIDRFPDVVYLSPHPRERFVALIESVAEVFPESPPYGGQFDTIHPHLTVAQTPNEDVILQTLQALEHEVSGQLPIRCQANSVHLIVKRSGLWEKHAELPLG